MWLFDRNTEEPDTQELYEVKWTETTTETRPKVTAKLVWGGGATKEITYVEWDQFNDYIDYFLDEDKQVVFEPIERPIYKEELERREYEYEVEHTVKAWVSEEYLRGVEYTGETKTVLESH